MALQSTTRLESTPMSAESEFIALSDRVLEAIGTALDAVETDIDWQLNDGVLTIDCASGGKLIVNRHLPNREIWVAAKSGGFHFRAESGVWRDSRQGAELGEKLAQLLRAQSGIAIALPPLRSN
jgi:CyaY protein